MKITIYGSSDDLVEVEGDVKGADEFDVYGQRWSGDLIAPGGDAMRVHAIYDGCWAFAVGQTDEEIPLPSWPLTIEQLYRSDGTPGYSVVLAVDVPDGTRLDNITKKDA